MASSCKHINNPSDSVMMVGGEGGISGLADGFLVAKIGLSSS